MKFQMATRTLVMPETMAMRTEAMALKTALIPRPMAVKGEVAGKIW